VGSVVIQLLATHAHTKSRARSSLVTTQPPPPPPTHTDLAWHHMTTPTTPKYNCNWGHLVAVAGGAVPCRQQEQLELLLIRVPGQGAERHAGWSTSRHGLAMSTQMSTPHIQSAPT
jgi:hypothetical protein